MSVRLSDTEADALDAVRGSRSRANWLRDQVPVGPNIHPTKELNAPYPGEPPMVDQMIVESPATEEMPEETVSTNAPVKKHFHKRGKEVGHRMHRGQKIPTYACAEPGCTHIIAAD